MVLAKLSRPVQRVVVLGLGWFFIVLGILGLFLPLLQGILFILVGLYLLSRESAVARTWFERLRHRFPGLDERLTAMIERLRALVRR